MEPPPPISCLIPSLPDDLARLCIARVPQSHHPFLAAVSRAWRAFLRSPLIFSVRLKVGALEHFLFINFKTPTNQSHWFLLDRPRGDYSPSLILLPTQPHVSISDCTVVALGHSLFLLGGSIDCIPSNLVQIYNARFNCWSIGPPMLAPRKYAAAGVICGRIYIFGGCSRVNENWAEEFDPEKQQWRQISSPLEVRMNWMAGYAVIGGKLFGNANSKFVIFDPALVVSEAWSLAPKSPTFGITGLMVVLDEVLYSYTYPKTINWYDFIKAECKIVEGIDEEMPMFYYMTTFANWDGLLCLVGSEWWGEKKMKLKFVGISVTKTDKESLRGSIGWSETFILPFPVGTFKLHCLSLVL